MRSDDWTARVAASVAEHSLEGAHSAADRISAAWHGPAEGTMTHAAAAAAFVAFAPVAISGPRHVSQTTPPVP